LIVFSSPFEFAALIAAIKPVTSPEATLKTAAYAGTDESDKQNTSEIIIVAILFSLHSQAKLHTPKSSWTMLSGSDLFAQRQLRFVCPSGMPAEDNIRQRKSCTNSGPMKNAAESTYV
jgi:hypothetical protein